MDKSFQRFLNTNTCQMYKDLFRDFMALLFGITKFYQIQMLKLIGISYNRKLGSTKII